MPITSDMTMPLKGAAMFGHGEQLFIWSWRQIAAGRAECRLIAREFLDACGADAPEVLATLGTFLQILAFASRRRLVIGHPGCPGITADERQVLTLLAAAQNDRPALLDAHLTWLAKAEARQALAVGAGALATALCAHDLMLTIPAAEIPAVGQKPAGIARMQLAGG